MLSDFRFVIRALVRNRSFTLVTILTLALGIGSAAAIFNVTDWVLFRANQYPSDVYLIGGHSPDQPFMPIRFPFMVRAYEQQTGALSEIGKAAMMPGNVVLNGEPIRPGWLGVTPNFFHMLGLTPGLGRGFLAEESTPGKDNVVVISYYLWRELGGTDEVLGRKIVVGDTVCTVVGALRRDQTLPPYFWNDVYRPLVFKVDPAMPWLPNLFVLGRLQAGVTREQAAKALSTVPVDTPAQLRMFLEKDQVALSSLPELNQVFRMEIYWVLVGAVGFLYAIACLNASNLTLVRMLGQRRELSIRLALGGGRWRIIRLMALESVTLAILASLLGVLIANWIFPLLLSAAGSPGTGPDWKSWNLGSRVLVVLGGLSVATSLLIVVIPALRMLRAEIHPALKDGGAALGEGRGLARLRGGFVVLQAAFAVILLTGAGLMVKTFQNLQQVDLGFDPTNRVKVQISVPAEFPRNNWEPWGARMRQIQAQLERVPGVRAVSFGDDVLLPGYYFTSMELVGPEGKTVKAALAGLSLGHEQATGLRLKRGRWHNQSNGNEIMVNETLARAIWPDKDPVGQLLASAKPNPAGGPNWKGWLVVGVVGDVRSTMRESPKNYVYGPEGWSRGSTFVVKLSGEYTAAQAGQMKRSLYAFDPSLVVMQILPLTAVREQQLWAEKMANSVLKVLAGIALVLTIVGIFSVLAYTVDRRMGEFGVRMALGATPRDLVMLVMRRGVLLTVLGVVVGVGGALGLTRSLRSFLFEVSPQNPAVLIVVALVLILAAVLGCSLPAPRARKVDVSKLLRSE